MQRGYRLPVGVLGANLWWVTVALPLALGAPRTPWLAGSVAAVTLAPLAAGLRATRLRPVAARWLLLAAYPGAVGLVVSLAPRLCEAPLDSPLAALVGALSLIAYGACAAAETGRPRSLHPCTTQPLAGSAETPEAHRRKVRRRALLAVGAAGAGALAVVAPSLTLDAPLGATWGEEASAAAALHAVVGGVLGVIAITRFVGPATRLVRRPTPPPRVRAIRSLAMVALAAVAFAAFLVTRPD